MISIDDLALYEVLWEVLHGTFKEPITGTIKFKMADGRHIKFQNSRWRMPFVFKIGNYAHAHSKMYTLYSVCSIELKLHRWW